MGWVESSELDEMSDDGLVDMVVGDFILGSQSITEVGEVSKSDTSRKVLEEESPKRNEHAVQAILRVSGLPLSVTEEDLHATVSEQHRLVDKEGHLDVNILSGINEPLEILIRALPVGSATAHLGFATKVAALRAQSVFKSAEYVQDEYSNCQTDLFSFSPPSVSGMSSNSAGRSSITDLLPSAQLIRAQIQLPFASEDVLIRDATSHSKDGTKYWGVSATGQWQSAQRDPRHALQASIRRSGGPSPHPRRNGTSPAMCLVRGAATSCEDDFSLHPASSTQNPLTFSCHLCPKRFRRAYNLRSHLRTHTDERPFVCTVCGKAFARHHDRKRHEGLHSDEKKDESPTLDAVRSVGTESRSEIDTAIARGQPEDEFSIYPASSTQVWREP